MVQKSIWLRINLHAHLSSDLSLDLNSDVWYDPNTDQ